MEFIFLNLNLILNISLPKLSCMNISENKTTFSFYSQTQYGTQNFRTETVKDSIKVNQKNLKSSTRNIIYNIVFSCFSEILEQLLD